MSHKRNNQDHHAMAMACNVSRIHVCQWLALSAMIKSSDDEYADDLLISDLVTDHDYQILPFDRSSRDVVLSFNEVHSSELLHMTLAYQRPRYMLSLNK